MITRAAKLLEKLLMKEPEKQEKEPDGKVILKGQSSFDMKI